MSIDSNILTETDKSMLRNLAKQAIMQKTKSGLLSDSDINELSQSLKDKKGAFVTLTKNGDLRGCIGYIMPVLPLYQAIIDNAYNAAYRDPRFTALSSAEIAQLDHDIQIEISVLTEPEIMHYTSQDEILTGLRPNIDGVIISRGNASATFLPQVWEQLPTHEEFLSHLCLKAGLPFNAWIDLDLIIETYQVIIL